MPKAKRTTLGKGWHSYHIGSEQSTKITSYIVAHGAYAKKHGTVTWTLPEVPLYFYTMHGHFMWIALEIYPVIGATQVKLPTSICGGGEVWNYQLSSFDEKQSEAAITCLENRDCPAGERMEIITLEAKSRSCLGVLLNVLRSRRLSSDSSKLIEEAGLEWKLHFLACRSDAGAVAEIGKRYEADSMKTGAQTIGQTNAPRPLGYFDSAKVIAAAAQLRAQVPALMQVHLNEEVRKHEADMQRYPVRHPDHAVFLREKIQVYESVKNLNLAAQADLAKAYCENMNQYVIARDFLDVEKPDIAWRTMGHAG